MPKSFLTAFLFALMGSISYSQISFNPILKDSLASDSISYTISGIAELNDSIEIQLELVEIFPDSLHSVYLLRSGFDQNSLPTNSLFQYNSSTDTFSVQCGIFQHSDLMVRLILFRNEEKIHETYIK